MRTIAAAIALLCVGSLAALAVPPDPSHIPFKLPKDIKWVSSPAGSETAALFGDSTKPGPYGVLTKWHAGHFSHPHFHSTDRYAYVVSGTWWVSASDHYDPANTFPLPAGSFATDLAGKVHWDGSKNGDVVIEIVGMGPMVTTQAEAK